MRQIDLGLDFLLIARATVTCRRASALSGKMVADTFSLIDFDGTRVCFLFRYSDLRKDVEYGFALYFQLPGQIVNSNFTHPRCVLSAIPLSDHHNPHETIRSIPVGTRPLSSR